MYAIKVEVRGPPDDGGDDERYTEAFAPPPDDLACVTFSAGNPRVEHVTGIVHLYRRDGPGRAGGGGGGDGGGGGEGGSGGGSGGGRKEGGDGSLRAARSYLQAAGGAAAGAAAQAEQQKQRGQQDAGRSATLCCLAIPADMPVAGFCSFVGAYMRHVKRMRVLRREGAGQSVCMVLLTFDQQEQVGGRAGGPGSREPSVQLFGAVAFGWGLVASSRPAPACAAPPRPDPTGPAATPRTAPHRPDPPRPAPTRRDTPPRARP
jgi:hypothetical protein